MEDDITTQAASSDTGTDSNDLRRFINTSLVDMVADRIRSNIYTGKYAPGKKMVVRELSEEFGVSHTPIKDALNRLISEGYVEALPRRSMVVRTFTNCDLIERLQVRLMFEIFCADEIIEQARKHPEIAEELEQVIWLMKECISDPEHLSYEGWVQNEARFHRCYMRYCGNQKVFELYTGLDTNKLTYFTYLSSSHTPLKFSTLESNLKEHEIILRAIKNLNAQQFIDGVICHLVRACEDYAVDEPTRCKITQLKRMTEKYRSH